MKNNTFKIKVKNVKSFIREEYHLYASGGNPYKRFSVSLRAGPNVERYKVEVDGKPTKSFIKIGDAVRYFNGN